MNFNRATFEYAAGKAEQLPKSTLPEVVFSGRSNVGKSSLINRIVNRKALARVSATPGKTATINFFDVDNFKLVDLPGYGYAKVSHTERLRWGELVEGYFAQKRNICLIVQIVDLRHPPTSDDLSMIDFMYQSGLPFIVVLSKQDKLNKTKTEQRLKSIKEELGAYENILLFPFSSLKGNGIEEIKAYITFCVENAEVYTELNNETEPL